MQTAERAGRTRAPTEGWRWRQVPEVPPERERRPRPVLRVLPGVLVVSVLWWLGHVLAALVLVAVLAALIVVLLASPAARHRFQQLVAAVQRGTGTVLTVVLMGAVQLLVFTPAAAVMRLLRHDPMALGARPDDPTFWRPSTPSRRDLYSRQFTDERVVGTAVAGRARLGPVLRVRAAIGLVVLLLAADVATGTALDVLDRVLGRDAAATVTSAAPWDVAAGRDEPWAEDLFQQVRSVVDNQPLHPLRGWVPSDTEQSFVNQQGPIRRSYRPPSADSAESIDVFFFGGSTTWGAYQRDLHTIPSEFARLSEDVGLPVRVSNYAAPGYAIWQEIQLFQELLTRGDVPDLVVFYDGVNELIAQSMDAPTRDPSHTRSAELRRAFEAYNPFSDGSPFVERVATEYTDRSAVHRLFRSVRNVFRGEGFTADVYPTLWAPGHERIDLADDRARNAVAIHRRGVEVAQRLAASYGVQTAFFWQPSYYTKDRVAAEDEIAGYWAEDPRAWRLASRVAREQLRAPVVDLGDALDDVDEPVMYDFHHTNEKGARVMAEAIFERVRGQLEALRPADR